MQLSYSIVFLCLLGTDDRNLDMSDIESIDSLNLLASYYIELDVLLYVFLYVSSIKIIGHAPLSPIAIHCEECDPVY